MEAPNELKKRARKLNKKSVHKKAKYVLCWLQQNIRAFDNPTIDAATYGNVGWCFGKLNHPSGEKEIYGKVGRPWDQAMRKRAGVPEWLAEQAKRETYRVFVPENV